MPMPTMGEAKRTPNLNIYSVQNQTGGSFDQRIYLSWTSSFLASTNFRKLYVHLSHTWVERKPELENFARPIALRGDRVQQIPVVASVSLHLFLNAHLRDESENDLEYIVSVTLGNTSNHGSQNKPFLPAKIVEIDLGSNPSTFLLHEFADDLKKQPVLSGSIGIYPAYTLYAFLTLQLSTVPPDARINTLPGEILDMIIGYLFYTRYDIEDEFSISAISDVCKLWRQRALFFQAEPRDGWKKIKLLEESPGYRQEWCSVRYTEEDRFFTNLGKVFIVALNQHLINNLDLLCPTTEQEQDVLDEMTCLATVTTLKLVEWPEIRVLRFLETTESYNVLRSLLLVNLQPPHLLEPSDPSSRGHRMHLEVFEVFKVRPCFLILVVRSLLSLKELGTFKMSRCYLTVTFHSQVRSTLHTLHVDYDPDFCINIERLVFDQPLDIYEFTNLVDLKIDGGHTNSNVVPFELFPRLRPENFRFLFIHYCSVSFNGFINFIEGLLQKESRLSMFRLDLFFGQWTTEQFQEGKRRGKELAGAFRFALTEAGCT
ncbi:hypothetical protein BT69DRAFT_1354371 [Atractiella rhizophila]|nr:hypothetical protein BT69DRAFT_1354371 [Atractiella rhizophila]